MTYDSQTLEVLRDTHDFPGSFMFKVIGENTPEFIARVVQATVVVLGPASQPNVSTRHSSEGNLQAITMRVEVSRPEHVLDVYAALRAVSGVKVLM